LGALTAVIAKPRLRRLKQFVFQTQLEVSNDPSWKNSGIAREWADSGTVPAVEAGVDVLGTELSNLVVQFRINTGAHCLHSYLSFKAY
jgi:hypothetical protein